MADSAALESPVAPVLAEGKSAEALHRAIFVGLAALLVVAPFVVYPVFLMKVLCFALFACAFNLLLGFGGLLSFGHAAYFGGAAYVSAHAAKVWGLTRVFYPEGSAVVIFVIMAIVLLIKPAGLFGRTA